MRKKLMLINIKYTELQLMKKLYIVEMLHIHGILK